MNEQIEAAIEALVNEVAPSPLVVSETALRQFRPLLQELVERRALASSAAAEMPSRPNGRSADIGCISDDHRTEASVYLRADADAHFDKLESIIAGLRAQVVEMENQFGLPHADDPLAQQLVDCGTFKPVDEEALNIRKAVLEYWKERAEKAELALSTAQQVGIRKAFNAYEAHYHVAKRVDDVLMRECRQCGGDLLDERHLRASESREDRILALLPKKGATP